MDPVARVRQSLAIEPEEETIVSYVYNPKDYCIPTYLFVPPELRVMYLYVAEAAYIVIQRLLFFQHLRTQRFLAMCPEKRGPVFDRHADSIRRVLDWKEQSDPADPTLAPAAKIPGAALGFHLDQIAYDTYARLYCTTLQKFYAIDWSKYCQRILDIKHAASRYMSYNDYMAWLYWWNTEFKPAMEKWQAYMNDLDLPSWGETVDELYDLIVERVEDSDEKTALQLAQGICSCKIKIPEGLTELPDDPSCAFQLNGVSGHLLDMLG